MRINFESLPDEYVFVYGTLKRRGYLNHHLEDGEFVSKATLPLEYTMYEDGYNEFPFLLKDMEVGNPQCNGELFKVPGYLVYYLDIVEGCPDLYIRQRATVTKEDGTEKECYVYIYNDTVPGGKAIGDFNVTT